jgi:hypothetical protein
VADEARIRWRSGFLNRILKKPRQRYWKAKAELKAEMKKSGLRTTLTSTSAYLTRAAWPPGLSG